MRWSKSYLGYLIQTLFNVHLMVLKKWYLQYVMSLSLKFILKVNHYWYALHGQKWFIISYSPCSTMAITISLYFLVLVKDRKKLVP